MQPLQIRPPRHIRPQSRPELHDQALLQLIDHAGVLVDHAPRLGGQPKTTTPITTLLLLFLLQLQLMLSTLLALDLRDPALVVPDLLRLVLTQPAHLGPEGDVVARLAAAEEVGVARVEGVEEGAAEQVGRDREARGREVAAGEEVEGFLFFFFFSFLVFFVVVVGLV